LALKTICCYSLSLPISFFTCVVSLSLPQTRSQILRCFHSPRFYSYHWFSFFFQWIQCKGRR